MSASSHLARKLQQALGTEAAEDMMSWMEGVDELRGDVRELRHEMQLGFAKLDTRIDSRLDQLRAELLRWSFLFWVSAVGAIAALAGVLK